MARFKSAVVVLVVVFHVFSVFSGTLHEELSISNGSTKMVFD